MEWLPEKAEFIETFSIPTGGAVLSASEVLGQAILQKKDFSVTWTGNPLDFSLVPNFKVTIPAKQKHVIEGILIIQATQALDTAQFGFQAPASVDGYIWQSALNNKDFSLGEIISAVINPPVFQSFPSDNVLLVLPPNTSGPQIGTGYCRFSGLIAAPQEDVTLLGAVRILGNSTVIFKRNSYFRTYRVA